jgi:hypothetical protein
LTPFLSHHLNSKCAELQSTLASLKVDLSSSAMGGEAGEATEGRRRARVGGSTGDREKVAREKLRALVDRLE